MAKALKMKLCWKKKYWIAWEWLVLSLCSFDEMAAHCILYEGFLNIVRHRCFEQSNSSISWAYVWTEMFEMDSKNTKKTTSACEVKKKWRCEWVRVRHVTKAGEEVWECLWYINANAWDFFVYLKPIWNTLTQKWMTLLCTISHQ